MEYVEVVPLVVLLVVAIQHNNDHSNSNSNSCHFNRELSRYCQPLVCL